MRTIVLVASLGFSACAAQAQSGATVADNCANHLNTSPEPTVEALLNCLAEMQRSIGELKELPAALTKQEVSDIAQNLISAQPSIPLVPDPIPSGAVIASTIACDTLGEGWNPLKEATGRFIVGAGNNYLRAYRQWRPEGEVVGVDLQPYDVLEIGGEVQHTLKTSEMPEHHHDIQQPSGEPTRFRTVEVGVGGKKYAIWHGNGVDNPDAYLAAPTGDGNSHNNMPPYIALFFCQKG